MASRRLKIGGVSYKIKALTHDQKKVLNRNNLNPNDWMFVSEIDSYMRIIRKDTIDSDSKIVKTICKYGRTQ